MFVQLDQPDAAGHKHGYHSKSYLAAISESDRHTGIIIEAIKRAGKLDDSLIVITSDHGGGGSHGRFTHGSDHPNDMTVFWGCHGPGIMKGTGLPIGMKNMDTAAIVLHALGLSVPENMDAKVPNMLFQK